MYVVGLVFVLFVVVALVVMVTKQMWDRVDEIATDIKYRVTEAQMRTMIDRRLGARPNPAVVTTQ